LRALRHKVANASSQQFSFWNKGFRTEPPPSGLFTPSPPSGGKEQIKKRECGKLEGRQDNKTEGCRLVQEEKERQSSREKELDKAHLGGALSPFNAWLVLRGLMTLRGRRFKGLLAYGLLK
jgi:hypothetical protein